MSVSTARSAKAPRSSSICRAASHATSRPSPQDIDESPSGKQETVLVVEDDPDVRAYVVETLMALNYRVREAANGEDALHLLDDPAAVDLLLTDVVMPGMNGRNLAEAAQRRRPGLKCFI